MEVRNPEHHHHRRFQRPPAGPYRLSAARRLLALGESRKLDVEITAGIDPNSDPMLAHRAAKLTSPHSRRTLAAGIRSVIARAEEPVGLTAAAPLARANVLQERPRLIQLADRLESTYPVSARGVAATRLLLTDGASPLYAGGELSALIAALDSALTGLEA